MNIRPPSESDGESSDGDYFPNEEDDEDEEYWDDNAEEFDVDETDLEVDLDDDWDERWSAPSEIAAFAEDGRLSIFLVQKLGLTIQQTVDRLRKEKMRRRMRLQDPKYRPLQLATAYYSLSEVFSCIVLMFVFNRVAPHSLVGRLFTPTRAFRRTIL